MTGSQPRAVHRALTVLEEVARAGPGVTAQEVTHALALPPATTYRLLNLLVAEEYLVRMPDLRGFALGWRSVQFAGAAAPVRLTVAARSVLAELRGTIRWGVHVASFTTGRLRLVDVDPDHPLLDERAVERHLHASALGLLLLADSPDRSELLPRHLPALTSDTVTDRAQVLDQARRAALDGRSVQCGRLVPGLTCIAVPVWGEHGELLAGVAVAGSSARLANEVDTLAKQLQAVSSRLGPLLA